MDDWHVVRRGKARPPRGGAVGGAGGDAAPRADAGSGRTRTKIRPSDTKTNIYARPNTVVMDGQEFSILPADEELAEFIHNHVLPPDEKALFQDIQSLFTDENARKYLVRMKTAESTLKLAELMDAGVSWPGYRNEGMGRDVIVKGYSMENPVINVTLSGVGWWTTEDVVRRAVEKKDITIPPCRDIAHL